MRKWLIVGNWKMNETINESIKFINKLDKEINCIDNVEVIICPSFMSIQKINYELLLSNIKICSQNFFWEKFGAFTGETSIMMIKEAGCLYSLIGHSERRQYFNETDEIINKKVKLAIDIGIIPIICIGETFENKKQSITLEILKKQITKCLCDINSFDSIIFAYEPVWSIGSDKILKLHQIQDVHMFIREVCKEIYGDNISKKIKILYGGSVKSNNISYFANKSNIDGVLVGRESLNFNSFINIIKCFKHC
jgi:triosephosphate isomerase